MNASRSIGAALLLCLGLATSARAAEDGVLDHVEANAPAARALAQDIWRLAEVGYLEEDSSRRTTAK